MELQLILLAYMAGICSGLKDVRIQVPTAVKKGDSAIIGCSYDMEGEDLYAVKWFKDSHEFYRYIPNQVPAAMVFRIRGLSVDISKSNATQVTITELGLDSAGRYSCEVAADAPTFHTEVVAANMNVVELPLHGPVIHGMKQKYRVGDIFRGNCTSDGGKPAANLTWAINGHQPLSSDIIHYNSQEPNTAEQQNSVVGLQFAVTPEHFVGGELKVRCNASTFDVSWQSREVSADEDRPEATPTVYF